MNKKISHCRSKCKISLPQPLEIHFPCHAHVTQHYCGLQSVLGSLEYFKLYLFAPFFVSRCQNLATIWHQAQPPIFTQPPLNGVILYTVACHLCDTISIATGHIFSLSSFHCYPSLLCFSQQVYICSFGKNGCSVEYSFFGLVEPGRRNCPCEGLTSTAYIYICLLATSLPTKPGLAGHWCVNWHLM